VSVPVLREFLQAQPAGPVVDETLVGVLMDAWDSLNRDDTRMEAFKLRRIEAPSWDGSMLRFSVERHGWTALGSTRAEMQHWVVDPRAGTAVLERSTHRQLEPMAPRLDVRPLVAEVAALIVDGVDDERLKWSADGTVVTVRIGEIILAESAARQTVTGRRRRFRAALDEALPGQRIGESWRYRATRSVDG
jgi:hypothetical protein